MQLCCTLYKDARKKEDCVIIFYFSALISLAACAYILCMRGCKLLPIHFSLFPRPPWIFWQFEPGISPEKTCDSEKWNYKLINFKWETSIRPYKKRGNKIETQVVHAYMRNAHGAGIMFTSAETTNKEGATEQSNQHQEDVPDSTTATFSVRQQQQQQAAGLPPVAGDTATPAAELAELTTAEISLDLQNLIEEASFDFSAATAATTAAGGHEVQQPQQQPRQQPDYVNRPGSLGSTGQASPGSSNGGQESPTDFQYRPPPPAAALAYLPGSVHHGSFMNAMNNNNNNVQVKQVIGKFYSTKFEMKLAEWWENLNSYRNESQKIDFKMC